MTPTSSTQRRRVLLMVLLAVFVLALVSVGTYRTLVIPQGNAFDFYTLWHGGRVFWAGDNPYDLDIAREIQLAVFGELRPDSANQQGYAYPAYASVLLAPFLVLPFPIAAAVWSALSLVGIALSTILIAFSLNWRPRPGSLLLLLLAVYFYRYALIVVVIGQMQVAIWLSLALALYLYQQRHDRAAGLVMVISALRPEFGLPLALAFALFAWRDRRRQFAFAWLGGLVAISLIALIRRPSWPLDFLAGIRLYSGYAPLLWPPTLFGLWGLLAAVLVFCLAAYQIIVYRLSGLTPLRAIAILIPLILIFVPQTGSYTLTLALIPWLFAVSPESNVWARAVALLMLIAPWIVWVISRNSPDLMPLEHLLVPLLVMLALSLNTRPGKDTLPPTADVQ